MLVFYITENLLQLWYSRSVLAIWQLIDERVVAMICRHFSDSQPVGQGCRHLPEVVLRTGT